MIRRFPATEGSPPSSKHAPHGRPIRAFVAVLLLAAGTVASGQEPAFIPVDRLLQQAGISPRDLAQDPDAPFFVTDRQFALYRALMRDPLDIPQRSAAISKACRDAMDSPQELLARIEALAGDSTPRPARSRAAPAIAPGRDPLAESLEWMTRDGEIGRIDIPPDSVLPGALRVEIAGVLSAIGRARATLVRSLARIPAELTPGVILRQLVEGRPVRPGEPDARRWIHAIDRDELLSGMVDLVAAVERLERYVAASRRLPAVDWRASTPFGEIVVDTTGRDNHHAIVDPLLVLDVGGNDRYEFRTRGSGHRVAVLLDHGGDDTYVAIDDGADPSAAVLGLGVLWDTEGNDVHEGRQLAQGAAILGAALLIDGGGENRFSATGHAQAFAVGGIAALRGGPGNDAYFALTHAQGSAGPGGVALLLDPAGDDRYVLGNDPVVRPSPQLPGLNTSMGQGAGRGIRDDSANGTSLSGGIGLLVDLAGNDRYVAQVFAQGTGFLAGVGLLVDEGGDDRFEAAWYAMGAAAHRAAGALVKRGSGNDRYRASRSTSMAAAHDRSVAWLLDEGGDDHYELGDLGLGATHEGGSALFVDAAGDDAYRVEAPACRALGVAERDETNRGRNPRTVTGIFADLGGSDTYPASCGRETRAIARPAR